MLSRLLEEQAFVAAPLLFPDSNAAGATTNASSALPIMYCPLLSPNNEGAASKHAARGWSIMLGDESDVASGVPGCCRKSSVSSNAGASRAELLSEDGAEAKRCCAVPPEVRRVDSRVRCNLKPAKFAI